MHKESDISYITLKDNLKYTTDSYGNISNETITVVTRLIKEILRQVNDLFVDDTQAKEMDVETATEEKLKKPESMIHLSTMINCFGMIIARRYSVLMPFIMKFNINKIINTFKNHSNLQKYLSPVCVLNEEKDDINMQGEE